MNLKNVGEIFQLSIRDVHVDPQQEYRNNSILVIKLSMPVSSFVDTSLNNRVFQPVNSSHENKPDYGKTCFICKIGNDLECKIESESYRHIAL